MDFDLLNCRFVRFRVKAVRTHYTMYISSRKPRSYHTIVRKICVFAQLFATLILCNPIRFPSSDVGHSFLLVNGWRGARNLRRFGLVHGRIRLFVRGPWKTWKWDGVVAILYRRVDDSLPLECMIKMFDGCRNSWDCFCLEVGFQFLLLWIHFLIPLRARERCRSVVGRLFTELIAPI